MKFADDSPERAWCDGPPHAGYWSSVLPEFQAFIVMGIDPVLQLTKIKSDGTVGRPFFFTVQREIVSSSN